jgi:diadenylate cyclase
VLAAGCVLPLADTIETGHEFGTRHRAAIGITAKTDALSIVISEETGRISICNNGRIVPNLDPQRLRRVLEMLFRSRARETIPLLSRIRVPSRAP